MDINQALTFLEIAHSGSFVAAAERLHLTQTAVSARIRTLEELLRRRLFVRNKAGARLTTAGERLIRHATTMIQVWERARQQVALPPGRNDGVSVGGELSLWHPLLADWLIWMHRECPEIALRAEVDSPAQLFARVQDGSLDLAVLYNPPPWPALVAELLLEEKLVLVTTSPDGMMAPERYVHVDWGPTFAANHQTAFPELSSPPVSISLGPLALTYLLTVGGCGYFRVGTAQPFLSDGRLHRVRDAPEFSHSAYAVYAGRSDSDVINQVRHGLKSVAAASRDMPGRSNLVVSADPNQNTHDPDFRWRSYAMVAVSKVHRPGCHCRKLNPASKRNRIGRCSWLMRDIWSLIWLALIALFRSRASLQAESLMLRHQLHVLRRKSP